MSHGAEVGVIVFEDSGFTPEEKKILRGFENDIGSVLLAHGIYDRPFWTSESGPEGRVAKLVAKRGVLLELASADIPNLSRDEMLSQLSSGIERLPPQ